MPKGFSDGKPSGAALATRERNEGVAALASLMIDVLGTDMVRARLGRERALQLLRLAGRDSDRLEQAWAAADPVMRQVTVGQPGAGYDRDPRHDPQVVKAILAGAPHGEVNALIKEATERMLANPPPVVGPPGSYKDADDSGREMGVAYQTRQSPSGQPVQVPVQKSVDYHTWEELHAQEPARHLLPPLCPRPPRSRATVTARRPPSWWPGTGRHRSRTAPTGDRPPLPA